MTRRNSQKQRKKKKTSRRRGRRWTRWVRPAAAFLTVGLVLGAGLAVYFWVVVGARFEGRLWTLPSVIYSDTAPLRPGMRLTPTELRGRLERTGYAAVADHPSKPGQYQLAGDRLDVHLRGFRTAQRTFAEAPVRLRFADGRLVTVETAPGERDGVAFLEPEPMATLYGARQEERRPLGLDHIPHGLVQAVLAAEDSRFYEHHGIDARGILRAAWTNLRHGRIVQGGSTITQQTAKNLFLDPRRSWWRKLRELPMAIVLDARYPKRRILEVYLNEVYLGQRGPVAICGVQAASAFYFGRDVEDLSTAEMALIAGLIRSPGQYNPFQHPEAAVERREQVLRAMLRLGFLEQSGFERAAAEPLSLASGGAGFSRAPYATDFVLSRLLRTYPERALRGEGLRIYTTLDTHIQLQAEEALEAGLVRLEAAHPTIRRQREQRRLQGAIVVIDTADGSIRAIVGGRDYRQTQFNRATQAHRQPGSCFKPFVYAAAFEQTHERRGAGLTPQSLLEDSPLQMTSGGKPWSPSNYDHEFRGAVTVRQALEESLNVPTVRAATQIGLPRIVETAHRCGIVSELTPVPSLALGTEEITPLELAEAYATFARQGRHIPTWAVAAVTDREGALLEENGPHPARALSTEAAYWIDDILRGVLTRGTARSAAALGYEGWAAGKTGTTDDTRDAWFVGYDDRLLTLVWVGYDDNSVTGLTGATGALPIWVELMNRIGVSEPAAARSVPRALVRVWIDPASGQLAVPRCPQRIEEAFLPGEEPTEECELHRGGKLRRFWRKLLGKRDRARSN